MKHIRQTAGPCLIPPQSSLLQQHHPRESPDDARDLTIQASFLQLWIRGANAQLNYKLYSIFKKTGRGLLWTILLASLGKPNPAISFRLVWVPDGPGQGPYPKPCRVEVRAGRFAQQTSTSEKG